LYGRFTQRISDLSFAQHANTSGGLKEILIPNQREVNARATASLATVGWEGSFSKYAVDSESEPVLAGQIGG